LIFKEDLAMEIKETLLAKIEDMEKVAKLFDLLPLEIYFLGGSACLLGDYTDRATRDFDFIDIQYPSKYGKAFAMLRSFDMLEYESTILAPDFKQRAIRLIQFKTIEAYVLSREDIIVSKIIRMEDKDVEDINTLIKSADKNIIKDIIQKVLQRTDLFESKKDAFRNNLKIFKEKFNI
jgi:hypothetical protein